ncbi:hypothetical protein I350_08320 [Cryptococcus amylolentus CBS 6273]|uniref:Uncharacterized protein n=1 Tax=Cryptococcus amylolentus CBS 6273 TaxID=1296118 RepID=A0A1E3J610_9TREE|nr:hypothetical protein I350_08320 [Cryptococcus amylolentus CBS 6273]
MDEDGKRVYDHPATYEEMRVPGGPELEPFLEFVSNTAAKKLKGTPRAGSSAMGALEALGDQQYHAGPSSLGAYPPNPVHPQAGSSAMGALEALEALEAIEALGDQQYHAGPSSLGAYYPPNPVNPHNQPGQPQQPLAGPSSHHGTSLLYPSSSVHPYTIPAMPAQPPVFGYHCPVPTQARQQLPPSMAGSHTVQRSQSHAQLNASLSPFVSAAAAQHQMMVPSVFEEGFGVPRTRRSSHQEVREKNRRFSQEYQQVSQLQQLYPDFASGQPSDSGLPSHIQPGFGSRLVAHQDLYGVAQAGNIHGPFNVNQIIYGGRSTQVGSSNDTVHLSQDHRLYAEGSAQAGTGPSSGMYQPASGAEYQDISPNTNLTSSVDSIPSPPNLTPEEMSNLLRCIDMSAVHLPQQQPIAYPEGCMDPRDIYLNYADGVHGAPGFGPPPFDLESLVVPHDDGCLKGAEEGSCFVAADPDAGLPLWQ